MTIKKTLGGKKVHVYKKKWKTIADSHVRHIWAFPDGSNESSLDPSYYAVNGTPMCCGDEADELNFSDEDMIYVRTEVLK